MHLSDAFARSPMRVAIENHRLVLGRDSRTAPEAHRLDIALTHAFAIAAGYGLVEIYRNVVVEVCLLMGPGADEPPDERRDPDGRVRIGGRYWPKIVEDISSGSRRELEYSAAVEIELAKHVT